MSEQSQEPKNAEKQSPTKSKQSTSEVRITSSVKEKDPRRVEAGRRLGAISKIAKERKANERLQRQKDEEELKKYRRKRNKSVDSDSGISESEQMDHTMLYLTAIGVLVAVGGLYFAYKSNKREDKIERNFEASYDEHKVEHTKSEVDNTPQPNLRSF